MKHHHPGWIAPYVDELEALETDKISAISDAMARDRAAVTRIAAALDAGPLDANGVRRLVAEFKETLGPVLLDSERRRVTLQHELAPLFEHLAEASDEDWAVYLDVILSARVRAMAETFATLRLNPPNPA